MNNIFILILLCLLSFTFAFSHEAHKEMNENKSINESVQKQKTRHWPNNMKADLIVGCNGSVVFILSFCIFLSL